MALNASLSRQFEFVQQQWISYGNDAKLGNEKDLLMAHHELGERFGIQGDGSSTNPPLFCTALPNFVELRGGDYFFIPSITALGMLAMNLVEPTLKRSKGAPNTYVHARLAMESSLSQMHARIPDTVMTRGDP